MSNLSLLKLDNFLESYNLALRQLNTNISDFNEKNKTFSTNVNNSISGINAAIKLLHNNLNHVSKNLTDFNNKLNESSKTEWPGPKGWKPESHDPNRVVVRAVPPTDPNISTPDKIWNYAMVAIGAVSSVTALTLSQTKSLYEHREKEKRGENPNFDTKALVIDAAMALVSLTKIGNAISTYYGIVSADGIRPVEYFTSDTYSTKPLGDLSSSKADALLNKDQQQKDYIDTKKAVEWFLDRKKLLDEIQQPFKNKSRKELKEIDEAFTETLKEMFEPEAKKGGIPKKKTKKDYKKGRGL